MNITPTASPVRSRVIHLADAQAHIPGPAGEHAVRLLQRGTLDVALSIPERPIPQSPHEQDELYIVIQGRGVLFHDWYLRLANEASKMLRGDIPLQSTIPITP